MTENYLYINKGQLDGRTGNVLVASDSNSIASTITDAAAADTAVGTVQTDMTTFLTSYDAIGAAIVAISGDTYSNTTHHFTNGGSTGLTSAQLHTELTALNAAIDQFLTAKTDAATAKTATALTKTDSLAINYPTTADFVLSWLSTHTPTRKDVLMAMEAFERYILADGVAGGQRGTALPNL